MTPDVTPFPSFSTLRDFQEQVFFFFYCDKFRFRGSMERQLAVWQCQREEATSRARYESGQLKARNPLQQQESHHHIRSHRPSPKLVINVDPAIHPPTYSAARERKKSFWTPRAFVTCCTALRISLKSLCAVYFSAVANIYRTCTVLSSASVWRWICHLRFCISRSD